jgi:hypothetical protein
MPEFRDRDSSALEALIRQGGHPCWQVKHALLAADDDIGITIIAIY